MNPQPVGIYSDGTELAARLRVLEAEIARLRGGG